MMASYLHSWSAGSSTLSRLSELYHELTGTTEIAKRREVVEDRYHRLLSLRKLAIEVCPFRLARSSIT
jgi:hypothetical protein